MSFTSSYVLYIIILRIIWWPLTPVCSISIVYLPLDQVKTVSANGSFSLLTQRSLMYDYVLVYPMTIFYTCHGLSESVIVVIEWVFLFSFFFFFASNCIFEYKDRDWEKKNERKRNHANYFRHKPDSFLSSVCIISICSFTR